MGPPDPKMVAAALLWLRNHYDLADKNPDLKPLVLKAVDDIIDGCSHYGQIDQAGFRAIYLSKWKGLV
jgi:hypothetical protein